MLLILMNSIIEMDSVMGLKLLQEVWGIVNFLLNYDILLLEKAEITRLEF